MEAEYTLTIYQLGDSDQAVQMRFMNYSYLESHGFLVDVSQYSAVYTGPLDPAETLDSIYDRFNLNLPTGYQGHSLSVSDVIVCHKGDEDTAYFVDSFGFREVPDFFLQDKLFQKACAEQDTYRAWLTAQAPEEILRHTYEYTVREDILMSLETIELSFEQVKALLDSPCPLADLYKSWEKRETSYMEDIRDAIENRADKLIQQKEATAPHRIDNTEAIPG